MNAGICNLVIKPDISNYSLTSFTNEAVDMLIRRGEVAAYKKRDVNAPAFSANFGYWF